MTARKWLTHADLAIRIAPAIGREEYLDHLRQGRAAIERELEAKLPPLIRSGGCVFGLDHRIPNGTPLEAYRFYVAKVWEIFARESGQVAAPRSTP
jgi:hypothetical protein